MDIRHTKCLPQTDTLMEELIHDQEIIRIYINIKPQLIYFLNEHCVEWFTKQLFKVFFVIRP